jgi:hypothetical protein
MQREVGTEMKQEERCDQGAARSSAPRQNLLRDNPKCRKLLDDLYLIGVREFRFGLHYLDGSSADTLFDRTWFAKGVRVTGRLDHRAREPQVQLSRMVEEAINESLVGTDAEGSDLFVVVCGYFRGGRQPWCLTASVTAITTDPYFTDREIQMI